jgi:CDP-2,3-bis-(O-geranylgeranyl)-sn-glycerol synthase
MSEFVRHVAELVYFLLPAYVANMAPPFVRFWHGWNRPISRRWLGEHKTVVGFAAGVLAGSATGIVLARIGWAQSPVRPEDWPWAGLALGFGALAGDAAKSFIKRRRGIAPGRSWKPADQLDFVVGALLAGLPWHVPGWTETLAVLAASFVAHIVVNHVAFWLGIRDTRW